MINAGDGTHEHPTQGLLDLLTLRDQFGGSRGSRSHLRRRAALPRRAVQHLGPAQAGRRGGRVRPAVAAAARSPSSGVTVFTGSRRRSSGPMRSTCCGCSSSGCRPATSRRCASTTACSASRASGSTARRRDLLILHPGPMNRGVEIDSDVADGPHSVILDQVTNGVAVRMAVLYLLAGGAPDWRAAAGRRRAMSDAAAPRRPGHRSVARTSTASPTCSSRTARSRRVGREHPRLRIRAST